MRTEGPRGYDEVAFSRVTGVADATAVEVGLHVACALSQTGKVHCWGDLDGSPPCTGQQARLIPGIENALQLAVGDETACVLDRAGDVQCWGSNRCEGLARLRSDLEFSRDPVAIPVPTAAVKLRAHQDGFMVLGAKGDVWYWSCNLLADRTDPAVKRVEGIAPAIDIVVGNNFGCALLADRNLHCFGPRIDDRPPGVPRPVFEDKAAWVNAPLYEVRTSAEEDRDANEEMLSR